MKLLAFQNLGNTCYLNSVLQCFINDPLFHENLKEKQSHELYPILKKIINKIDLTDNEDKIMFKYNLNDLVSFIHLKTGMQRFIQQDAHEFLVTFLDLLLEINIEFKNTYYGETINVITCKCCGKHKKIFETFNTLNLPIVSDKLTENFSNYLKTTEQKDPKNLYQCDHCKTHTISEQRIYLNKLPKRFIIVLKKYNESRKIKINYPRTLNIKETYTSIVKKYTLCSVISHLGDHTSGHYNCLVKINNDFYFMDDDVILLDEDPKCEAYLLIYSN